MVTSIWERVCLLFWKTIMKIRWTILYYIVDIIFVVCQWRSFLSSEMTAMMILRDIFCNFWNKRLPSTSSGVFAYSTPPLRQSYPIFVFSEPWRNNCLGWVIVARLLIQLKKATLTSKSPADYECDVNTLSYPRRFHFSRWVLQNLLPLHRHYFRDRQVQKLFHKNQLLSCPYDGTVRGLGLQFIVNGQNYYSIIWSSVNIWEIGNKRTGILGFYFTNWTKTKKTLTNMHYCTIINKLSEMLL